MIELTNIEARKYYPSEEEIMNENDEIMKKKIIQLDQDGEVFERVLEGEINLIDAKTKGKKLQQLLTKEQIEKYKADQIERYNREQKQHKKLFERKNSTSSFSSRSSVSSSDEPKPPHLGKLLKSEKKNDELTRI